MKIIEIRNTRYGEVAYVLDEERGRVIKLLVDDHTGYNEVGEDDRPPVRRRLPVRETVEEIAEEELPPEKPPVRPRVAPKSIIPPHLAGVFLPPDSPGAAVERRNI